MQVSELLTRLSFHTILEQYYSITSYFRYHISVASLAKQRSALIKAVSLSVLLVIESSGETRKRRLISKGRSMIYRGDGSRGGSS